ncbi:MAG: hypothetical protein WC663_02555 [Patescibacteria group bacterium]|jgi:hypothetical protein
MAYIGKRELKQAMKGSKTSWSQRGGQTAKNILKEAPGYKMSTSETERFLKEKGMSESGAKKVMKTIEQPTQAKQETFKKPEMPSREVKGQEIQKGEMQKGGMKTPEWVEKVEQQGEISQTGAFGRQVEEDVRLQKAGQQQQGLQRQPSSDVDRSRYSQEEIDRLEQSEQTKYFDRASKSNQFEKLDKAEEDNAAKIDSMLSGGQGGGGGETGGGGTGGEE